jgi:hypothetical protein
MSESNDRCKPVFFIDMEGTILSTISDDLLDEKRGYLKDFSKYVKSKGFKLNGGFLVLRPGIKVLLRNLKKLGTVVLFSGASQCEVDENVKICGLQDLLDGWFGAGSGEGSNGWPIITDGGFCLIDDAYNTGKLSIILDRRSDHNDMERHLIKVNSFRGDGSDVECRQILKTIQSRIVNNIYYSVTPTEKA